MSDYRADRLDDLPLFRRTDGLPSRLAGLNARHFAEDHKRLIVRALTAGPGTKDEIAARCRLTEQQVVRRRAELVRTGLVELTGETRLTASGNPAEVWRLVEQPAATAAIEGGTDR
jgi:predicted ArsR family transcriptional regulator